MSYFLLMLILFFPAQLCHFSNQHTHTQTHTPLQPQPPENTTISFVLSGVWAPRHIFNKQQHSVTDECETAASKQSLWASEGNRSNYVNKYHRSLDSVHVWFWRLASGRGHGWVTYLNCVSAVIPGDGRLILCISFLRWEPMRMKSL